MTNLKACLIVVAAVALTASAQTNISIYRNDGQFNQIRLADGEAVGHSINDGTPRVEINDWISGPESVPVDAIDSCILRHTDVPVLRLTLTDYPDAEVLWEKELYLKASMTLEGNGYCDDIDAISLQVRGRGNSTWGMPKKPMRLKFPKKIAIANLKKTKNVVLLNNYLDQTMMRNAIAMWLARRLGVPFANSMEPCNVFINGHYAGAYTMTEKVGINSASVDIDETRGILFELSTEFDEKYRFRSEVWNLPVMVKDPDFDELYEDNPEEPAPEERLAAWKADFNRAEALAADGKGADAFDIESLVNYTLLYNIVCNHEIGFPKSLYIHKKSLAEDEKYFFGPAWDFDVAFNFATPAEDGYTSRPPQDDIWTPALIDCLMETDQAKTLYAERWNSFINDIYPELLEFFDCYAELIAPSAAKNGLRWPSTGNYKAWAYHISSFDFHAHTSALRSWIIERVNHLDKQNNPPAE